MTLYFHLQQNIMIVRQSPEYKYSSKSCLASLPLPYQLIFYRIHSTIPSFSVGAGTHTPQCRSSHVLSQLATASSNFCEMQMLLLTLLMYLKFTYLVRLDGNL